MLLMQKPAMSAKVLPVCLLLNLSLLNLRLSQDATKRAILGEQAIIPLYFQTNAWAMRRGLTYEARTDEMTLATSVHVVR